jgi:bacterioferritin-associated ferredoxin
MMKNSIADEKAVKRGEKNQETMMGTTPCAEQCGKCV